MKSAMKKIIVLLIIFTLLMPFITGLHAEVAAKSWTISESTDYDGKSITAELNKGVLTISGEGYMKGFNKYNDSYNGTKYNTPWNDYNDEIKTIIIEDGVKSIGRNAFEGCSNLTNINIFGNIELIENNSIPVKSDLTVRYRIDAPNIPGNQEYYNDTINLFLSNNSVIKSQKFWDISEKRDCSLIMVLDKEGTGTVVGDGEMARSPHHVLSYGKIKKLVIENGITEIPANAAYQNQNLQSVLIADSVEKIGDCAFAECRNLQKVVIPSNVTEIGENAFAWCHTLTIYCEPNSYAKQYAIEKGIKCVVEKTWDISKQNDNSVQATYKADAQKLIITGTGEMKDWDIEAGNNPEWYAYKENITIIKIEEGVKNIGKDAFSNTTNLESITIPDSVISIDESAFSKGTNLVIECSGNSEAAKYAKRNQFKYVINWSGSELGTNLKAVLNSEGTLRIIKTSDVGSMKNFNGEDGALWSDYKEDIKKVVIESGVENIGNCAFWGCTNLTDVQLSNGLEYLGNYAFKACTSLQNINFPDSVTELGEYTFEGCTSLTSVNIPKNVTQIGAGTFKETGLIQLIIPDGVTIIKGKAFENCENLESVKIPDSVTYIGQEAFSGCDKLKIICNDGSAAEKYAIDNDIKFEFMGSVTPEKIILDKTSIELDLNGKKEYKLTATIEPDNVNYAADITWTSSDESVAKVKDGVVTAIGEGTCYIKAVTENEKQAICNVTVINTGKNPSDEEEPGNGSDDGTGEEPGNGSDDGTGDNSGNDSGNGSNDGTGDGSENGSGNGSDNGTGDGSGNGSGNGSGDGTGDGSGNSSGDGTGGTSGNSSGNGSNNGLNSNLNNNGSDSSSNSVTGNKDITLSSQTLPKTGNNLILLVGIIVVATISGISYKKFKNLDI